MAATAQHLRHRAWAARAMAERLESAPLLTLDRFAGAETWQCPAADEFLLAISLFRHQILGAADDLRWEAQQLDRRAAQEEAAAVAGALIEAG